MRVSVTEELRCTQGAFLRRKLGSGQVDIVLCVDDVKKAKATLKIIEKVLRSERSKGPHAPCDVTRSQRLRILDIVHKLLSAHFTFPQ
jgi:hypothetical protein